MIVIEHLNQPYEIPPETLIIVTGVRRQSFDDFLDVNARVGFDGLGFVAITVMCVRLDCTRDKRAETVTLNAVNVVIIRGYRT